MIILDRDGSLHHYPPSRDDEAPRQARVSLRDEQAEPNIIDRIIDFAFDVLGIGRLEVRVYEHQER